MVALFANQSSSVVLVHEGASVRQTLSEAIRGLGFSDITQMTSASDLLHHLEAQYCDWLVMPLMAQSPVTALHILDIVTQTPRLQNLRMSLLVAEEDYPYLPAAFQLGLMSYHSSVASRAEVITEFQTLLKDLKANNWNSTLVAAHYLRTYLAYSKRYEPMIEVHHKLLPLFPGFPGLLVALAEAYLWNNQLQKGLQTLSQVLILDERFKELVEHIKHKTLKDHIEQPDKSLAENVLGLERCLIIDPDSAVTSSLKKFLESVGGKDIQTFDDGLAAWQWIQKNGEPDLIIMEWRLPGCPGPLLLQRIREQGMHLVPVIIVSSVIPPKGVSLLREMGVAEVIAKPFGQKAFFASTIWTLQQKAYPTEGQALERKMRALLATNKIAEAEQLRQKFSQQKQASPANKMAVEAEFAYAKGQYSKARDLAVEALRNHQGDSLVLLNIVGKASLKMNDNLTALKFFEKLHALSPMNLSHICNMATSYAEGGNSEAAQNTISEASKLDADNSQVSTTQAQIFIMGGQAAKAKELVLKMTSLTRIVSYMNSRAVVLSRTGNYQEGMKIYQETIAALPAGSHEQHAVEFNLAMAFAREGDLPSAANTLQRIEITEDSPLAKKIQTLEKRVKTAIEQGSVLSFAASDANQEVSEEIWNATASLQPGDLGLFRIFEDTEGMKVAAPLLANPPHFRGVSLGKK